MQQKELVYINKKKDANMGLEGENLSACKATYRHSPCSQHQHKNPEAQTGHLEDLQSCIDITVSRFQLQTYVSQTLKINTP